MSIKAYIDSKKNHKTETKIQAREKDKESFWDPVYYVQAEGFYYSSWLYCGYDLSGVWFI